MLQHIPTLLMAFLVLRAASTITPAAEATVVCEEVITAYDPADNGAGPLWCYGSPLVVRQGATASVSIIQTGKDVPPLCNTRWQVWQRGGNAWRVVSAEAKYRQREPCPLVGLQRGELFLSANPSTQPPGTKYGPCTPVVIRLAKAGGSLSRTLEKPAWADDTYFTDHSYRGFAADAARGELLLLNIHARTSAQFVSHRDGQGAWHARGKIAFPIRAAYPQVALRAGAAHVMAIGDIREPVPEWRELKRRELKREWDYVFRRLFYTNTLDLEREPFSTPLEVDTVEKSAGQISNLDLHVDAQGTAHLLYLKRPHVHAFLRDKYFPGEPFSRQLEYVTIRNGQIDQRRTLCQTPDNSEGFEPTYGRFHVGPLEKLYVIAAGTQTTPDAGAAFVNRIFPVDAPDDVTSLSLNHAFHTFFTNTPRGGSLPSDDLDLFGIADDAPNLRYAHVRLNID